MGFFVIRAARSAFPDLIAVKKGKPLLIECKFNAYISWKEKVRLLELARMNDAQCAIAYNDKGAIRIRKMTW
jgi:Holliday junction resolvase